jgi:hypothetical protein
LTLTDSIDGVVIVGKLPIIDAKMVIFECSKMDSSINVEFDFLIVYDEALDTILGIIEIDKYYFGRTYFENGFIYIKRDKKYYYKIDILSINKTFHINNATSVKMKKKWNHSSIGMLEEFIKNDEFIISNKYRIENNCLYFRGSDSN